MKTSMIARQVSYTETELEDALDVVNLELLVNAVLPLIRPDIEIDDVRNALIDVLVDAVNS